MLLCPGASDVCYSNLLVSELFYCCICLPHWQHKCCSKQSHTFFPVDMPLVSHACSPFQTVSWWLVPAGLPSTRNKRQSTYCLESTPLARIPSYRLTPLRRSTPIWPPTSSAITPAWMAALHSKEVWNTATSHLQMAQQYIWNIAGALHFVTTCAQDPYLTPDMAKL